jgi:protein disulfide-isomerase A6
LAGAYKGMVKIAYWDTEQQGRRPALLGEIKGTPTIRLYVPKKKQGDGNKKLVIDYNYERKAKDMKAFVDENMPSFIERVSDISILEKFQEKAAKHGLPQVLLFSSKAKTLPISKYLSTEFRRRLLLAEIHPTKPNKDVMDKYGITELPALIVIPPGGGEPIRYQGDGFTKNKLQLFLSKHALKEKVLPAKKKPEEEKEKEMKKEEEQKETKKEEEKPTREPTVKVEL